MRQCFVTSEEMNRILRKGNRLHLSPDIVIADYPIGSLVMLREPFIMDGDKITYRADVKSPQKIRGWKSSIHLPSYLVRAYMVIKDNFEMRLNDVYETYQDQLGIDSLQEFHSAWNKALPREDRLWLGAKNNHYIMVSPFDLVLKEDLESYLKEHPDVQRD